MTMALLAWLPFITLGVAFQLLVHGNSHDKLYELQFQTCYVQNKY